MPKRVSLKGRGADLFFGDYTPPSSTDETEPNRVSTEIAAEQPRDDSSIQPRIQKNQPRRASQRSQQASKQAQTRDGTSASMRASYHPDVVEEIRRLIKVTGREVTYVRLTGTEKEQLADTLYTLKKQGKRTTENEISRIAVNFILQDYQANGDASILSRVIDALLA